MLTARWPKELEQHARSCITLRTEDAATHSRRLSHYGRLTCICIALPAMLQAPSWSTLLLGGTTHVWLHLPCKVPEGLLRSAAERKECICTILD